MISRYAVNPDINLKAGYGLYIQSPQGDEITVGEGPKPKAETSVHYTVGYEHQLTDLIEVDLSVFYTPYRSDCRNHSYHT